MSKNLEHMKNLRHPSNGERHGIVNEIANSVGDDGFKHFQGKWKEEIEKLKKEDSKIVKVRFHHYQGPHERLTKPYARYAGDPIQTWHLIPGEVYEVPMGFVKEVNDPAKRKPRRSDLLDHNGIPMPKDGPAEIQYELLPVGF